jgi:hypothetical protein
LILLLTLGSVQAQTFRGIMPVWIKNNSGSPMSGVQVRLEINTEFLISLGLMQPNGNDIRFGTPCGSTPGTFINYFLEGPPNTSNTPIWVLSPTIPANDSTRIFMYFGNSGLSSGSTLNIFNGPHSSTDSVVTTNITTASSPGQRGFRFAPNEDLLVAYLGNRTPTGTQRYVTLFEVETHQILAQSFVSSGTPGQYHYAILAQPFWVLSGQQYILTLFTSQGDQYYFGTSTQVGQHLTYYDMRYCNNCTQNSLPQGAINGVQYGQPDFLYYVRNSIIPEPGYLLGAPADTNTPSPPSALIGSAGDESAILSWNMNLEFDINQYFIYQNSVNNPNTAALIDSVAHPNTIDTVTGLVNGTTYYFWVKAKDYYCSGKLSGFSNVAEITPIGIVNIQNGVPKVFALHQNYPNPFNPMTKIRFDLPKGNFVKLTVYDLVGREVAAPVSEQLGAGYFEVTLDAANLASGVYLYKIEAGDFTDRKKMIIVK